MGWLGDALATAIGEGKAFFKNGTRKSRLKSMLADRRFPKGFRSTQQLMSGIGADRAATEELLLSMGARRSESSDEWTMNPFKK